MEWLPVEHDGTALEAANFLDGVLVRFGTETWTAVYVTGWLVLERRGDMDGNAFRRRKTVAPTYGFRLEPIE